MVRVDVFHATQPIKSVNTFTKRWSRSLSDLCGRHLIVMLIFKCLNRFNGNAFTLIFMLFVRIFERITFKGTKQNDNKLLRPSAG